MNDFFTGKSAEKEGTSQPPKINMVTTPF
jgi:hypothetical protein